MSVRMDRFIKVNKKTACPVWVNVSHIAYLYDQRIVFDFGKTEIVTESAEEMLTEIREAQENNE